MQPENFELHVFESDLAIDLDDRRVENFFNTELVTNISKSNQICTIEDMLGMGLQCSPVFLEKISTAAILTMQKQEKLLKISCRGIRNQKSKYAIGAGA